MFAGVCKAKACESLKLRKSLLAVIQQLCFFDSAGLMAVAEREIEKF